MFSSSSVVDEAMIPVSHHLGLVSSSTARQEMTRRPWVKLILVWIVTSSTFAWALESVAQTPLTVPEGFEVTRAAAQPLVERPMFAALDEHGNLYVLDSGGANGNDRAHNPTDVVRRLTDTDGDGIYDKSVIFADKIVFGTGLAYYDNAIFVTSPPSLWKYEDTSGDGIADKRTELVTGFAFNQSCTDDVHGACLGPDGRIYFLPGRFQHKVMRPGGDVIREGMGPWLMRCRPDGSDVEIVSGAVGNPVEVAFLASGDAFLQGTFWAKPSAPDGLRDALVHAVLGGEYSVRDRDYSDRIRTGDFLPALVPFTNTAPSGITAYINDVWGPEYHNNLFSSHFNTGKILRHRLSPAGGTFTCETEDFVAANSSDVHFTDVLEDADGSLLVVDTGGWFHACCPASGSSKPEVKGSIYRVSKSDAQRIAEAYGNSIAWQTITVAEKIRLLDDPRPAVRERAVHSLAQQGSDAIAALSNVLKSRGVTPRHRQQCVWTLCRMDEPAARQASRLALSDSDAQIRQSAAQSAGLHRDIPATQRLIEMLKDDSLAVRREAANALGRIRRSEAVAGLLEAVGSLSQGDASSSDRFLEHAYIFALINIGDVPATRQGLSADSFATQRAALLALDQMSNNAMQASDIGPLLSTSDPVLQQTMVEVLSRHPEWTRESIQWVDRTLREQQIDETQLGVLVGIVRALSDDGAMRNLLNQHLAKQDGLSLSGRRALLLAIGRSGVTNVPANWQQAIAAALRSTQIEVALAALQAAEQLSLHAIAADIRSVASESTSDALRLSALRTLVVLRQELTEDEFDYLLAKLSPEADIQLRLSALDIVVQMRMDGMQLRKLNPLVSAAGPIELPRLLSAYAKGTDIGVGRELIQSLESSVVNVSPEIVEQALRGYPDEVKQAALPLLARLEQSTQQQLSRINELERLLEQQPANADRGRELFFGKALCQQCHAVAGRGAKVGPDLSDIGAIRSTRDLIEAVVFPSATFARGFEPMSVVTKDGRVLTGLAGRESTDEFVIVVVQDSRPVEVSLRREDIEEVKMSRVSTMPNGLDQLLQPQELSDLIGYLRTLKYRSGK